MVNRPGYRWNGARVARAAATWYFYIEANLNFGVLLFARPSTGTYMHECGAPPPSPTRKSHCAGLIAIMLSTLVAEQRAGALGQWPANRLWGPL